MNDNPLNLDLLMKTFNDLPVGIGIFHVPDLEDIKTIEYVFMNKVVLYEMRKSREEVFGKKVMDVAPEAFAHEGGVLVLDTYRKVAKEGGVVNLGLVEYSNHMVEGTYECSVHPIKEHFVYVMLRNVTDLEFAKNELEMKNDELSQLTSIVSHDLKSPLNNVLNLIEIFKEQYQSKFDQETQELFVYLSRATERMKRMVHDVLDFSSLGAEKEKVEVDCNQLLFETLKDLGTLIKETNARVQVSELPTITGYETELRMLFQNLITNALKFRKLETPPDIHISAEKKEGWTFTIKDNGIGIAEEHQEKIFGVFHRLHSKKEFEGSGIGLANCKKIVNMHRGKIGVHSQLGEGSSFYFTVPEKF